ncbi:hypothetical protein EVAR_2774_1 [Eumeta japonica]|uniref:Uncharacterized protein n=1 Tax=Eumeta variegata TaxID=151549 RepID=A0A4C1SZG6_EUMVA|nr:hypothetical protein EVAR_2774_1 [Eumeta japonica]
MSTRQTEFVGRRADARAGVNARHVVSRREDTPRALPGINLAVSRRRGRPLVFARAAPNRTHMLNSIWLIDLLRSPLWRSTYET